MPRHNEYGEKASLKAAVSRSGKSKNRRDYERSQKYSRNMKIAVNETRQDNRHSNANSPENLRGQMTGKFNSLTSQTMRELEEMTSMS
jgi:hypothetical protein